MASTTIRTLTENNFDDETRKGLVLVDFWAEWCGPCHALAPTVESLATDYEGRATVAKLNIDEHPGLPARFNIRGIPTLLLFKDGQVAESVVGVSPKSQLARLIDKHL